MAAPLILRDVKGFQQSAGGAQCRFVLSITVEKKVFRIVAERIETLKKSQKKKSAFAVACVPQKVKYLDIFPGLSEQAQRL